MIPASNVNFCAFVRDAIRLHRAPEPMPEFATARAEDEGQQGDEQANPLIKLAHAACRLGFDRIAKGEPPRTALAAAQAALSGAVKCRRVLQSLQLDRIAAVDRPCQEGAVASIIKRDPTVERTSMNYSALESQVDDLIAKIDSELAIDKARRRRVVVEHEDDGDTWSEHADSMSDGNNADLSDLSDDEDPEDEEDGQEIEKASINASISRNDMSNRPGAVSSSTHGQGRHKFEALADKIRNDEGVPKSSALAMARTRFPDVFASYQAHLRRPDNAFKAAPGTYEQLVSEQIAKGFSPAMAAQRVANLYGYRAFDNRTISKREGVQDAFERCADNIWKGDETLSRTEALRAARREQPRLFKAMQSR